MKDSIVAELLKEHKKVILPGLGMFMASEYAGKETIMFNPYLQINDGMITKFLTDSKGISEPEALKEIEDYVTTIKEKTATTGYVIPGVGELSSKGDGAVNFVQSEDFASSEASAPPPVKQAPKEKPKPEEKSVFSEKTPSETPKSPPAKEQKKVEAVEQKTEEKPIKAEKKQDKKQKDKAVKSPTAEKKSKKKWVILTLLLLFFGGLGTLGFLKFDTLKNYLGLSEKMEPEVIENTVPEAEVAEEVTPEESVEPVPEVVQEEIAEEVVEALPEETLPAPTTVAKASGAQNKYHVVAGSFSSEENATRFVEQLNQKGYSAQLLGKFGSLYQVSAGSVADKSQANAVAARLKDDGMDSWIRFW